MSEAHSTGIGTSSVLLPDGWATDVSLYWDESGRIVRCVRDYLDPNLPQASGVIVPGMVNVHSHAFQRGMTGRTQRFSSGSDDFWSWRDAMYSYLATLGPTDMRLEAERLYSNMLRSGYTSVCEFHYIHNDIDGSPYTNPVEMSLALIDAAKSAGIGLTLLPVFYEFGGFEKRSTSSAQRRFVSSAQVYFAMLESLLEHAGEQFCVGYAPHSLRAVGARGLESLLEHRSRHSPGSPVHIHISEQLAEVEACLETYGERPVNWLLDHFPVDETWCLVHATHINENELLRLCRTGATVGLCPTTEADLGDGIFPVVDFLDAGGIWGIGSDSNLCINPFEEIRLLEYVQRLTSKKRNIDGSTAELGAGTRRFLQALSGGAKAAGRPVGRLDSGCFADFLVIDSDHPLLEGKAPDDQLNTLIFSGDASHLSSVYVRGRQVST